MAIAKLPPVLQYCPQCGWSKTVSSDPIKGLKHSYETCPECGYKELEIKRTNEQILPRVVYKLKKLLYGK